MKPLLMENCRGYLLAHATKPADEHGTPPLRAITISRETGAGAVTVGRLLMDYLQKKQGGDARYPWAVFDRELVKRVLEDHKLPEALAPYLPEDSRSRVNDVLEDLLGVHPSAWTLVEHTKRTILRLALTGNAIIVGRGAHLVTASLPHVFHVRLIAPLENRIRHVQSYYELSREDATDFVRKEDRAKSRYLRRHFRSDVKDPLKYHLTINTGLIGFGEAARLIGDTVLRSPEAWSQG